MRIFTGIILSLFLICGISYAQEEKGFLDGLPNIKQGMAWDLRDDEVLSLTSVDVAVWKNKLALGLGGLTDLNEKLIPAITLSYKIGNLEQFGFEYPLQNLVNVEIGVFGGRDFQEKEYSYGIQGSIIKIKL